LPLRAIAYSCTSGTLALGYEEVAAQIKSGLNKDIRDSVAVVTPLTAALDAIKTLGLKRIAMLTPYIDSVNQPMKDFFEQHGIRIVKLKSLMVESDVDIAQVPPAAIKQGAEETYIEEADGLFISCTALRSTETLGELEASLQRTVLSSNQCMFWSMMKAAGYKKSITGYGQLLENFL
jgi:maleate isomerase